MSVIKYSIIVILAVIVIILSIILIWYIFSNKNEKFRSIENEYLKNIKIYVINMENRPDRKEHTKTLLDKLGFTNYQFIVPMSKDEVLLDPMITGSTLNHSVLSLASTVLNIFRETQEEEFVIMEDDLIFNENGKCSFEDIYNSAKDVEWDLLYYEFCYEECQYSEKISPYLFKLYEPQCTAFIIFKKSGAIKILNNFDKNKFIDYNYKNLTKTGILKSYGYPLFIQNPEFGSSIVSSGKFTENPTHDPICRSHNLNI
jgi:hypothetical protein